MLNQAEEEQQPFKRMGTQLEEIKEAQEEHEQVENLERVEKELQDQINYQRNNQDQDMYDIKDESDVEYD